MKAARNVSSCDVSYQPHLTSLCVSLCVFLASLVSPLVLLLAGGRASGLPVSEILIS